MVRKHSQSPVFELKLKNVVAVLKLKRHAELHSAGLSSAPGKGVESESAHLACVAQEVCRCL